MRTIDWLVIWIIGTSIIVVFVILALIICLAANGVPL